MVEKNRHFTRSLPMLCASALLGLGTTACGGARRADGSSSSASSTTVATETGSTTSSVIPPGQPVRGDGDADNPSDLDGNGDSDSAAVGGPDADNDNPTRASHDFPDTDDKATFVYGHPPSAAAARAISRVVERYYAAASAGNGAEACSLLLPSLARSVSADYGGDGGPPYLHGAKTCKAVLSLLFQRFREELAEAITVVEVRVKGNKAQVIFSSRKMPASSIFLERRGSSWKLLVLIGQPLP
jgi:hypothetical protein